MFAARLLPAGLRVSRPVLGNFAAILVRWIIGGSRFQEQHVGVARTNLGGDEVAKVEHAGRDASVDAVVDEVLGTRGGQ